MASIAARLRAMQTTDDQCELIAGLGDSSALVIEAAAKHITAPEAVGQLLAAYQRLHEAGPHGDSGCWGRMAILEALARLDAPDGVTAARLAIRTEQVEGLNYKITDTAVGLRIAAASMLANARADGALLDLALLLNDFEPNYRCSAAERPFAKLATRVAAAKALGALGDLGGVAVLAVKLVYPGEEQAEVLAECIDALAALGEPRACEWIEPWLRHGDSYLVSVAATALARLGKEQVVPLLEREAGEVVAEARASLVYALASIRADAVRAALCRLAEHEDERVSAAAREYIGVSTVPGEGSV
jgi:HEAT repeat protein